jgi:hypothetical protein
LRALLIALALGGGALLVHALDRVDVESAVLAGELRSGSTSAPAHPGQAVHLAPGSPSTSTLGLYLPLVWKGDRSHLGPSHPVRATPGPRASFTPTSVSSETPPDKTATPTATSTDAPPTITDQPPTVTPTPTPSLDCVELLQNGDFESGAVSWSLTIGQNREPVSQAIQPRSEVPVPPHGGEWLAWLGGFNGGLAQLRSSGLRAYEPTEVMSGTLSFWVALQTQEMSNRRPNDRIRARIEGARRDLLIDAATRSEEDFPEQNKWQRIAIDFTDYLGTDEVENLTLEFEADEQLGSWYYFDDVSVTACRARRSGAR